MIALAVVGGIGVGGFIGWWAGLALCPDWGDIGLNAIEWCVGGAAIGMVVGGGTTAAILT